MIEQPRSYEIRTLHDMLAVPSDRWPAMCEDLLIWLQLKSQEPNTSMNLTTALGFRWFDDGVPGVRVTLVDDDGNQVVTIPVANAEAST